MQYSLGDIPKAAQVVLDHAQSNKANTHATLITFSGDLGAGKTTLIQEIARQLGITDTLQSPTYVIYKKYKIPLTSSEQRPSPAKERVDAVGGRVRFEEMRGAWTTLIHGDMYRLESAEEILRLEWQEMLDNPENLICIEWPEKITPVIPDWAIRVVINHEGGDMRSLEI